MVVMLTSTAGNAISIVTLLDTGTEILLLVARHVSTVPRSDLVSGPIFRVFWTTCWYVPSYVRSISSFSFHQVTSGLGFPGVKRVTKAACKTSVTNPPRTHK